MEISELLIPTILGGICVLISVYGLAIAIDRKYALGGLFLYSLIPINLFRISSINIGSF